MDLQEVFEETRGQSCRALLGGDTDAAIELCRPDYAFQLLECDLDEQVLTAFARQDLGLPTVEDHEVAGTQHGLPIGLAEGHRSSQLQTDRDGIPDLSAAECY